MAKVHFSQLLKEIHKQTKKIKESTEGVKKILEKEYEDAGEEELIDCIKEIKKRKDPDFDMHKFLVEFISDET